MRTSKLPSRRRQALLFNAIAAAALVLIVACSSGGSDPTPAPTPTPIPPATDEPTAIPAPAPAELAKAEPTVGPTAVAAPTVAPAPPPAPAPTSTPRPTSTPTPIPTATPVVSNVFDAFGFSLQLDQDATFASSNIALRGWTESEANNDQGLLSFTYNGATVVMFWEPQTGDSPQAMVDATYELQKLSRPDVTFTPINEGDLTVDGETGRFGGFVTADSLGGNPDGGLIGAWTCEGSGITTSLTVNSPDSTALQIRFDRLISGYECAV